MPRIVGSADGYSFHLKQHNGRYSQEHVIWLPSVTRVIKGVLASDALMRWQYSFTRDAISGWADTNLKLFGEEVIPDLLEALTDSDILEEELKANRLRPMDFRDEAGERGNAAHDLLETLAHAADPIDLANRVLLNPASDQFQRAVASWWLERNPTTVASEVVVYSLEPHGGYAGSLDFIYDVPSERVMVDLKTRKEGGTAYESDEIQVAAYDAAWTRMTNQPVDRRAILIARADGTYQEYPATIPPAAFFHLLALYQMIRR